MMRVGVAILLSVSVFTNVKANLFQRVFDAWTESQLHKSVPKEIEEEQESYVYIDEDRRLRVLSANSSQEMLNASGQFGKCGMDITLPVKGALVCDPPNALPQICSLVCQRGYYSSGPNKDIACADNLCRGSCTPETVEYVSNELRYGSRECSYTQWKECDTTESGLCLETVTEPCSYSYYVESKQSGCKLTEESVPSGCWSSGCMGSCEKSGGYHYYTSRCPSACKPWQDPEKPNFVCSPCRAPVLPTNSAILESDALSANDPPSQITVGCAEGYWGTSMKANCMSYDGSFYPPVIVACSKCSVPPTIEYETFVTIDRGGFFEYKCADGYAGESTYMHCNKVDGSWPEPQAPECYPDVSPSPSVSPSATLTPGFSLSATPSNTPAQSPSVSKTPRAPKVKGSRAPSPAAKQLGSAPPNLRQT